MPTIPLGAAYVTSDEATVSALTAADAAYRDWGTRLHAELVRLPGVDPARLFLTSPFLRRRKLYALAMAEPYAAEPTIPDGFRVLTGRRGSPPRMEPRTGRPGEAARKWLERWQPPRAGANLVSDHGAPSAVALPHGDGQQQIHAVSVLVRPGEVHLLYARTPDPDRRSMWAEGPAAPDDRWKPEPLSQFHAALEAAQAESASTPA